MNSHVTLDIKTVVLDDEIKNLYEIHKYMMENLNADTHSLQLLKGADIQHSDLMFDFNEIYKEYEAYEYKNFDILVDQLNLIKQFDKKILKHFYIQVLLILIKKVSSRKMI